MEPSFIVPGVGLDGLVELIQRLRRIPGHYCCKPIVVVIGDRAADRASSFLGFPISEPVQHQDDDGRDYINSLYGMTNQPFEELVPLARSWSNPPPMNVEGRGFDSFGYDRSERIYRLRRKSGVSSVRLSFDATSQSPVRNLALLIENWGTAPPQVRLDDRDLERGDTFRFGYRHTLEGSDLIIWIDVQDQKRVSLLINSEK